MRDLEPKTLGGRKLLKSEAFLTTKPTSWVMRYSLGYYALLEFQYIGNQREIWIVL